ncbi:hypothetical protein AKJ16_DCAP16767 [Drosera capensis]
MVFRFQGGSGADAGVGITDVSELLPHWPILPASIPKLFTASFAMRRLTSPLFGGSLCCLGSVGMGFPGEDILVA